MPHSLRAYAKHRAAKGLAGGPMAVSVAVREGRLKECVARAENGDPKITDFELADREWERNTDSQRRLNAGGGVDRAPVPVTAAPALLAEFDGGARLPSLVGAKSPVIRDHDEPEGVATATERLKSAQADLAELKRDEARGELVPARDVERRLIDVFSACKTRLLAIPSRARQALPHLVAGDLAVLESLIREACEDLAEGSA